LLIKPQVAQFIGVPQQAQEPHLVNLGADRHLKIADLHAPDERACLYPQA
jgi:hypothetical protein